MIAQEVPPHGSTYSELAEIPFYDMKQEDKHTIGITPECAHRWLARLQANTVPSSVEEPGITKLIVNTVAGDMKNWTVGEKIQFTSQRALKKFLRKFKPKEATDQMNAPNNTITRIVVLDIEAYELQQQYLTELGVVVYDRSTPALEYHHIIIEENQHFCNSRYLPDRRSDFVFGQSTFLSTDDALIFLRSLLSIPGTALVGHSLQNDLTFLRKAKLNDSSARITDEFLRSVPKFDTQKLYQQKTRELCSLSRVCQGLGIEATSTHNAGNDAAYTLSVFLQLTQTASPLCTL